MTFYIYSYLSGHSLLIHENFSDKIIISIFIHRRVFRLFLIVLKLRMSITRLSLAKDEIPLPATLESAWWEEKKLAWIWEHELLCMGNKVIFRQFLVPLSTVESIAKKYRRLNSRKPWRTREKTENTTSKKLWET